ncbi:hypothetical protein PACTADRAFT_48162 [Pachysolen tannophilus NRRL Y-2460]|uniref:aminodeoxychorismate synthase n=1 Tax=Pachysolen tannophilus NRRL Y-2460 TaxID=669874 RepID=A0A1E4U3A9_PACTA|nr:hypothetical protein PACTADRAFT_48162 [Pachysolen tannophilus NRRL Y-2460]
MSILLVDSYDSFTFNLKNLVETSTGAKVYTVYNDSFNFEDSSGLDKFLEKFDCIIVGPGPGHPENLKDIGSIGDLFSQQRQIPILGICLGFQVLCSLYGNKVDYLEDIKHGQVCDVNVVGDGRDNLFKGIDSNFKSVRYHSLHVNLTDPQERVLPLAYTRDGSEDILMAVRDAKLPHFGVQYHPESICSEYGSTMIKNFWEIAKSYNKDSHRVIIRDNSLEYDEHIIRPIPLMNANTFNNENFLKFKTISSSSLSTIEVCDYLKHELNQDFLLLNSASSPGDWSIIGLPIIGKSEVITHSTDVPNIVELSTWGNKFDKKIVKLNNSIWKFVSDYMSSKMIGSIQEQLPFVGGLIGFFSYEEGFFINSADLQQQTDEPIPDTKLCFIERFILHDLKKDLFYIASILNNDDEWITKMSDTLPKIIIEKNYDPIVNSVAELTELTSQKIKFHKPDKENYFKQFEQCQKYLKKGDSYELCLTTQCLMEIPNDIDSWSIYKILAKRNPSPYSSFLKFQDCELISSSPERFISWNNEKCQLRPIKGTLKNSPNMTFEKASKILHTPKEMGENLMIVDLIRHDLYNFLDKVHVPKLMEVEKYKTVYQLVSVIEGSFSNSRYTGIDILSESLPPGSMTGAPKKRSVELLQKIEQNKRRGIYSGICGYWSLNNFSDWSVIIRSCYHYTNDLQNTPTSNLWRIGAGGAITVLSDPEGEWQEMGVKIDSVLQAFV